MLFVLIFGKILLENKKGGKKKIRETASQCKGQG
nr:MAG TPA: hypothetical protein [Caudoviricetes sp.]